MPQPEAEADESIFAESRAAVDDLDKKWRVAALTGNKPNREAVAAVVQEIFYLNVLPLIRQILDEAEEADAETAEAFDEIDEGMNAMAEQTQKAVLLTQHAAATQALADYVASHYPEDPRAVELANAVLGNARGIFAALAADARPGVEPEPNGTASPATAEPTSSAPPSDPNA